LPIGSVKWRADLNIAAEFIDENGDGVEQIDEGERNLIMMPGLLNGTALIERDGSTEDFWRSTEHPSKIVAPTATTTFQPEKVNLP